MKGRGGAGGGAVARDAGVARLVYVSAYGASPDHPIDFMRTKHAVERARRGGRWAGAGGAGGGGAGARGAARPGGGRRGAGARGAAAARAASR